MIKTRSIATMLLFAMMLSFAFVMVAPLQAEATGKDVFKDFQVGVTTDGKLNVEAGIDKAGTGGAWGTLIQKYQEFITGIAAIGAVTMVVLFIIQFLKLGASAGNPKERSMALSGVLWTGLAAAGLGAVALITSIFYRAIES